MTDHVPSRACYNAGCRLPACREEGARYRRRLAYDHSQNVRRLVDATQARVHAERLVARDWTHRQIADAAGVERSTVTKMLSGRPMVSRSAAAGILSVPLTHKPRAPRHRVDATGTRRRIQALMVLGYPVEALAPQVGVQAEAIHLVAMGESSRVERGTAAAVAAAYRKLLARPA
ncbi:hypothetical protein, partial [Streptomyces sp. UH6]|uniref:hypothetical protein n=1 Tax=Streptomyces sp. UH6 TaxID=2748379 RepID=UPI00181653A0